MENENGDLIRCKECLYCRDGFCPVIHHTTMFENLAKLTHVEPDDFCCHGKRRKNDGKTVK
jgi:hypothetical protein